MTQAEGRESGVVEFSRRIPVDSISHHAREVTIEASAAERQAIASRLGLQELPSLAASVRLRRVRGDMIKVSGSLFADVVQTCVVSLEPVPNHVEDHFEALFAPPHLIDQQTATEVELDINAEDPPEAIVGGGIDVGELAAQYLSLALDPYPRCPSAVADGLLGDGSGQPGESSPFAALSKLKQQP